MLVDGTQGVSSRINRVVKSTLTLPNSSYSLFIDSIGQQCLLLLKWQHLLWWTFVWTCNSLDFISVLIMRMVVALVSVVGILAGASAILFLKWVHAWRWVNTVSLSLESFDFGIDCWLIIVSIIIVVWTFARPTRYLREITFTRVSFISALDRAKIRSTLCWWQRIYWVISLCWTAWIFSSIDPLDSRIILIWGSSFNVSWFLRNIIIVVILVVIINSCQSLVCDIRQIHFSNCLLWRVVGYCSCFWITDSKWLLWFAA